MKIQIIEWKPFNGTAKALKGKINVRLTLTDEHLNIFEIKDISYFDNGSKKWIQFPEKRTKDIEGKWSTEIRYLDVIEPKFKFQDLLISEITRYLASKPI